MSAYIGEIRLFAFSRIPRGWVQCNGQLIPKSTNSALFSLLGTSYGGDGVTSFGVPNLCGTVLGCVDYSNGYTVGATDGNETITLTASQLPIHTHTLPTAPTQVVKASSKNGMMPYPDNVNNTLATISDPSMAANLFYNNATPDVALNTGAPGLDYTGQAQPQPIRVIQPYLVLSYCICATDGIYPTRG